MRIVRMILPMLFVMMALTTQAQQPKTALEMNNYLTDITDSVYLKGQAWGKKLNEVAPTGNFKDLATNRKDIQQYLLRKEKEVKALKDVGGSTALRQSILEFIATEKALVEKAFAPFETLTSNSTDEDFQKQLNALSAEAKTEGEALQKIQVQQKAFAKANDFKLEESTDK